MFMKSLTCSILWICACSAAITRTNQNNLPEQIHLSWTGDSTSMFVTWATPSPSDITRIRYGQDNRTLSTVVDGNCTVFIDGASAHKKRYIHRVTFTNLKPGTRYYYQCQSDDGWSPAYSFRSIPAGTDWSPRLLVYGDMGEVNARSLAQMTLEVQQERFDLVLHVGDFAYDMPDNNGDVGDEFLRSLEPLSAIIPYMVVVGNHEEKFNFSHYRERFTTPGNEQGMFYSFNVGPLHISIIATEFYYFPQYGVKQMTRQYDWFSQDLEHASKNPDNAWIFVVGHRPMYCSNIDLVDCNPQGNVFRKGIPALHIPGLEKVMHDSGADVGIWAHEHAYERSWPLYDVKVMNGSRENPYTDPKGIVHIVTGSAGCKENHTTFNPNPPDYTAFRTTDYGYTRMTVMNTTHMYFEQVSDDKGYIVVDSIWIRKTKPGRPVWYNKGHHKEGRKGHRTRSLSFADDVETVHLLERLFRREHTLMTAVFTSFLRLKLLFNLSLVFCSSNGGFSVHFSKSIFLWL